MSVKLNQAAASLPCTGPSVVDDASRLFSASANPSAAGTSSGGLMAFMQQTLTPPARCASEAMAMMPVTSAVQIQQMQQQQQQQQQQMLQLQQRAAAHPLAGAMQVAAVGAPMYASPQRQAQPLPQQLVAAAAPQNTNEEAMAVARYVANMPSPTYEQLLIASGKQVCSFTASRDIDYSHSSAAVQPEMLIKSVVGDNIAAYEKFAPGKPNAKLLPIKVELVSFVNQGSTTVGLNLGKIEGTTHTPNGKFLLTVAPGKSAKPQTLWSATPTLDAAQLKEFVGSTPDSIMQVAKPLADSIPMSIVPKNSILAQILKRFAAPLRLDFPAENGAFVNAPMQDVMRVNSVMENWIIDNASLTRVRNSLNGVIYDKLEHWTPDEMARVSIDRADGYAFGDPRGVAECINGELGKDVMMRGNKAHMVLRYTYVVA